MILLTRPDWTPGQSLSVAALIVNPETNGGTVSDLTPETVSAHLPADAPAWAVFDQGRAVFVVGLWPFSWNPELTRLRGILHVAGTREVRDAWRVIASFCDALPGVEILTFTDVPALARLAYRAGFKPQGMQGTRVILGR